MAPFCFASPWASGIILRAPGQQKQVCNHRMTLLSHEKIEQVFGDDESGMAKYKLELEIPGTFSRELRKKSVNSLKKNSEFKGFRKGTIPPFIRKDIDGFVFHDSVNEIINAACSELSLTPIEGDASEPEMDLDEMKSRFKVGTDFQFTCSVVLEKKSALESEAYLDADAEVKDVEDSVVAAP